MKDGAAVEKGCTDNSHYWPLKHHQLIIYTAIHTFTIFSISSTAAARIIKIVLDVSLKLTTNAHLQKAVCTFEVLLLPLRIRDFRKIIDVKTRILPRTRSGMINASVLKAAIVLEIGECDNLQAAQQIGALVQPQKCHLQANFNSHLTVITVEV
uniref:Uncharacterized protein n=1 Tax=Ascaris lumbricoides TaxID=6252 RepID=A0A0M3IDX6_ASCLU